MTGRAFVIAVAVAVTCGQVAPAVAQRAAKREASTEARARALFVRGNRLLDAGDYTGALAKYRAAFALAPRARIGLNIATTLLLSGDTVGAANQFAAYLAMPDRDAKRVPRVEKELAGLDAGLGRVAIVVAARGASVFLDGVQVGTGPVDKTVRVAPGRHQVRVMPSGRTSARSRDVDLAPGEQQRVVIDLSATPAAPAAGSGRSGVGGTAATVSARAPRSLAWNRRPLGAFLRSDVDIRGRGAIVAPGAVARIADRVHLFGALLIGRDRGFEVGARYALTRGNRIHTFATFAVPTFFVEGPWPGVRGAVGAALTIARRAWITAEVGGAYALSTPDYYGQSSGLASLGLEFRL